MAEKIWIGQQVRIKDESGWDGRHYTGHEGIVIGFGCINPFPDFITDTMKPFWVIRVALWDPRVIIIVTYDDLEPIEESQNITERHFTPSQAAEFLGIQMSKIQQLIENKELPIVTSGTDPENGKVLIPFTEINAYREKRGSERKQVLTRLTQDFSFGQYDDHGR